MLGKTPKCLALLKGLAALWFIATDNLKYIFKKMVLFILFIREKKKNNVRRISFLECLCYVPGMKLWASRRLNTRSTMNHTPAKDPIL